MNRWYINISANKTGEVVVAKFGYNLGTQGLSTNKIGIETTKMRKKAKTLVSTVRKYVVSIYIYIYTQENSAMCLHQIR